MNIVLLILMLLAGLFIVLHCVRFSDNQRALHAWHALENASSHSSGIFSEVMVEGLPDPARRYFRYMIKDGTPLHTAAEVKMGGQLGLGPKENPGYMPMKGLQLLAPPYGFVWRLRARKGPLVITGNEGFNRGRSWIRFWILGTVPIVRGGNNPDHYRSAFGRIVSEAALWTPAVLLPQYGCNWTAVDADTARATIHHNGLEQSVDITVNSAGQPLIVVIDRWSDANPCETYQLQPFGGYPSEFREFDGYMLPTKLEGGNHIGTDAYFPFYKASVKNIRFIKRGTVKK